MIRGFVFFLIILSVHTPVFSASQKVLYKKHIQLFDYFLPASSILTPKQEELRQENRERLWAEQEPVLKKVLENFEPSTTPEQFLMALLKSDNSSHNKIAFQIRKLYLSFGYTDDFSNNLASIEIEAPIKHLSPLDFPPTSLQLKGDQLQHQTGVIDYLIIGSGPAGSLIASELREMHPGDNIILMDAGSFVDPMTSATALDPDLIESNNRRTTLSGGIILRNGQVIGGGSTVNIDLAFSPLLPQIKSSLKGWINQRAMPAEFFHEGHREWEKLKNVYAWVEEKIGTRSVSDAEINPNNRLLLESISTAKTYKLNQKLYGKGKILKNSSWERFILPALQKNTPGRGSLTVLPNVKAMHIDWSETPTGELSAKGVTLKVLEPLAREDVIKDPNHLALIPGSLLFLEAKNIIIASGTLGSAELLLRSKLPNPLIGHGIVLHPSMAIVGEFDRDINAHTGLSASVYAPSENPQDQYFFEAMGDIPSFLALIHPGTGQQILHSTAHFKKLGGFGIMLVDTVHFNNHIFIDPKTDQVEVCYELSEGDKNRLKKGLIKGVDILFSQGAKSVFIPSYEIALNGMDPVFKNATQAKQAIQHLTFQNNANFITSAHMQGSNKMGTSSKNSVVSQNFKVWNPQNGQEIPNVYIVDSSIFPTSVGANPMQSIYTFAKIFVDFLK